MRIAEGLKTQWPWGAVLILLVILGVAFGPPIVGEMERLRSEAAIEAAEDLRVAFYIFHGAEGSPLRPGEARVFHSTDMDELRTLRSSVEGRPLSDFLSLRTLRLVRGMEWERPGVEDNFVLWVEFYEALGRYRQAEIRPSGIEWVGSR